jgi:outer membrane protein TolC
MRSAMNDLLRRSACLCLLLLALPGLAAEPLTEAEAVRLTVAHNPALRAALLDVRQGAETIRAERARYRPTLLLDATASTLTSPSLTSAGSTARSASQALVFGAALSQTFSWGTTVDLRLENRDSSSQGTAITGTSDLLTLGPGYGLSATLSLTQPLLRGFGNDVGQADLRAALLAGKERERARDATASSALSALSQAWWELWYAQRALAIEREARALALQQRDEAQRKVAAGSLADVDLLTYETRVAELDQSVLVAEVTARQRAVLLRQAMGERDTGASFDLSTAEPPAIAALDSGVVLAAAQEASYAVAQQRVAVEGAENTLRTAAEATRPRLDVQAWVQTQGLGNQAFAPALTQLGTFANPSANLGLVFELPLSAERHGAQRGAAEVAVRAARERLEGALQQVAADTATELATLEQATQSVALAQRTAEVSTRNVAAQRKRFATGSAIALEVQVAEDSLRRAQLSIERARVDAVKAQVRLEHLTANLLARWGVDASVLSSD